MAKTQNHDPNHQYRPIPMQSLAIQNQNQVLLQELENYNPTQVRINT
jgi:hypothetical protein